MTQRQFQTRRHTMSALLAALSASAALPAFAQQKPPPPKPAEKWPVKPIRIVVAFPAGGLTDAYARMFAEQLTAKFGQPVVVENKPGAGAILAIDTVAKAPADGYTMLLTTSGTVWQNRVLYSKLPYNLDKDLVPAVVFPSGPLVVAVAASVPAKNIKEFAEFAKKNPAAMGTYAPGSYPQMVADQLNKVEGTKVLSVHYRGEAPMWVDLASGQVQIAIGSYQSFSSVQSRVKAIGVTGNYRSPKLPDVPTLAEQGVAGRLVTLEGALPLMLPAGTPESVLQALSQAAVEGANTERAAKLRETFAIPNKPKKLADMRKDWEQDVPVWIKQAVDLGIKLD
jgi:tripartite-type tricarboxylate transporter receptor subunit TctC